MKVWKKNKDFLTEVDSWVEMTNFFISQNIDVGVKIMTLQEFIKQHRQELDEVIQNVAPGAPKSDNERRLWILNDEGLYNWARSEGVKV